MPDQTFSEELYDDAALKEAVDRMANLIKTHATKAYVDDSVNEVNTMLNSAIEGINESETISGSYVQFDGTDRILDSISIDDASLSTTSLVVCGRNLYPKYESESSNGLSWTVASDGTLTFSGTPTADVLLRLRNLFIPAIGQTITIAMNNNMTNSRLSFFGINPLNSNNWQVNCSTVNTVTTIPNPTRNFVELRIRIPKDVDWTGLVLKPMLVFGNAPAEFEEYVGSLYSVTLVDGVVQEHISLLSGINTIWAYNGNVSVVLAGSSNIVEYVNEQITKSLNSFYRFETNENAKYLYIYLKSGEYYVRWQLHNVPAPNSNSNTWQIGRICGVSDLQDHDLVEIVRGGEFELAIREHGAADYCGGNNHGDETTDTFVLHVDGKQISALDNLDNDLHPFNRIDAFEIATVNRCDTPSEAILKHQKIWAFEDGKVKVRQTIKFLEELFVDTALVCMFAALRSTFKYGVRKGGVDIEDMTTSDYTKTYTRSNDIFYEMYGDNATAKIHAKTDNPENKSVVWINNAADLNKLYYGYYGVTDSSHPTTVPIDTVITAESEYDVAYTPLA